MRVIELTKNPASYSCRSYLILGDWNQLGDVNTLVDPGSDGYIIDQINGISTGFGKLAVEQIILTHNHFDHSAGVAALKDRFGAMVYGFCPGPDVDELLYDGQFLKVGDGYGEVVHTPGHSSDSICLYIPKEQILFCGDTQLRVITTDGVYTAEFLTALEKLAERRVERIYPGHDQPLLGNGTQLIRRSLELVRSSTIIPAGGDYTETQRSR